jgi:TPR repeat protein
MYCPKMSFYCAEHKCAHILTDSGHPEEAIELLKKTAKDKDQSLKKVTAIVGAIIFFAALCWVGDTPDPSQVWGRIFVVIAVFIVSCAIYPRTKRSSPPPVQYKTTIPKNEADCSNPIVQEEEVQQTLTTLTNTLIHNNKKDGNDSNILEQDKKLFSDFSDTLARNRTDAALAGLTERSKLGFNKVTAALAWSEGLQRCKTNEERRAYLDGDIHHENQFMTPLDDLESEGEYIFAQAYLRGEGVTRDIFTAGGYIGAAAEKGNDKAQVSYGDLQGDKALVRKDYTKAAEWYFRAAEQGNIDGQALLGMLCAMGLGVTNDITIGLCWLTLACGQMTDPEVQIVKQFMNAISAKATHEDMDNVKQLVVDWRNEHADTLQRRELLSKALLGDDEAQYRLALAYEKDNQHDSEEAAMWYSKSAEQGHIEAQYNIGRYYECGIGVVQDLTQAAGWYRKAADKSNHNASISLGALYAYGQGVQQSYAEAYFWLSVAANVKTGTVREDVANAVTSLTDNVRSKCSRQQISNVEERLASWLSAHTQMLTGQGGTNGHE